MVDFTTKLINQLEQISDDVNLPLERRLIQMAVWFHKNKDRVPRENLPKRLDFLEKSLDITLELFAMSLERLQLNEGRHKSASLWLPSGMNDPNNRNFR